MGVDVPEEAQGGFWFSQSAVRLEGLEGWRSASGVEYGNLRKVKVLEGEGVGHAASGVEGPVRV